MSSFKEARDAYKEAKKAGKKDSELASLLREWFFLATSMEEIGEVCREDNYQGWDDAAFTWKEYAEKVIVLSEDDSDLWGIVENAEIGSEEESRAFDKILSLCQDKEDAKKVLEEVAGWWQFLELEYLYLKIFVRGRELPERPQSKEEETAGD